MEEHVWDSIEVLENTTVSNDHEFPFEIAMSPWPWSYRGRKVNVKWNVIVEVKPKKGESFREEKEFYLLPEGRTVPEGVNEKADTDLPVKTWRSPQEKEGVLGVVWGLILYFSFTALTFAMFYLFLYLSLKEDYRRKFIYQPTQATVLEKRMLTRVDKDSDGNKQTKYAPQYKLKYSVRGHVNVLWTSVAGTWSSYISTYQIQLHHRKIGETYPAWYDPNEPKRVVFDRSIRTGFFQFVVGMGALFVGLLLIGAVLYGVYERICGWVFVAEDEEDEDFNDWKNLLPKTPQRRGRVLKNLLVIDKTKMLWPAVVSAVLITLIILWIRNAFLVVYALTLGGFDFGEWILLGIFAYILYICVVGGLKKLLEILEFRAFRVECETLGLYPGIMSELYFEFRGDAKLTELTAEIECIEHDNASDERIFTGKILDAKDFKIRRGVPFKANVKVQLPSNAMHSLDGDEYMVIWRMIVKGWCGRKLFLDREYPLFVRATLPQKR